jgi:two-component system, OmpR family, phosphate regulon sensor histidine kinase PhoR
MSSLLPSSTAQAANVARPLYWAAVVRVMAMALLAAFIGWIISGIALAMALAFVVALVAFAYHASRLAALYQWLHGDHSAATLPEANGTWGDMLSLLYKLMRESRQREAAMTSSLARFQEAADALPDGAVMLDTENNIVWCNPMAESHWRISLANDRMQTITYFIRYPEFIAYLDKRDFNTPLTLKFNHHLEGGGSEEVTFSVQLVAFGEDQSLLLSRDVSERDRLERMRSDFVANVSHELRTPLTVMAGFLETLQKFGTDSNDDASDDEPSQSRDAPTRKAVAQRALEHMSQQTERMQRLVDDLLTLSRLENAQSKLAETIIDMYALVDASLADARALSSGRHRFNVAISQLWLVGNRDEMSSVVTNLIANAVRYTPDGGTIAVALNADINTGELVLEVHDNGEGIAPEHIPRLTERFYRVDRGRSRAAGGTGLGLAIVKHVLMRHGGRLEIESAQGATDHGSTFRVILPRERTQVTQPRPMAA